MHSRLGGGRAVGRAWAESAAGWLSRRPRAGLFDRIPVIIVAGSNSSWRARATSPESIDRPNAIERSLCQFVIDSGKELVIDEVRIGLRGGLSRPSESAALMT